MTEITHLVVNGCSWTYCQGLKNPEIQGWPRLLADKLGIKVINLAIPGSSNDGIHRRTYEYVINNLPTGSKPFFVLAWSQYWRQEGWYEFFDGKSYQDYHIVFKPTKYENLDEYQREMIVHWNEENHFRKTMLHKASLISLFQSLNIPYVMSDYSGTEHDIKIYERKYPNLVNFVYNKNHLFPQFFEVAKDVDVLPCGHDGPAAQPVLTNYIYERIKELYKINVLPSDNFINLKKYKVQKNFSSCWDYFE